MKVTAFASAIFGALLATGYAAELLALIKAVGPIGAEPAGMAKLLAIVLPIPAIIGCVLLNRNPRSAAVFLGGSAFCYAVVVGWIALPIALLLATAAAIAGVVSDRAREKDEPATSAE